MYDPALQDVIEHADIHRSVTHECTPDEFAPVVDRIDGGLDWGVGAIVMDDDDRVLLIRERDRWQTPGGEVEDDETHHEALRREVEEETGLLVEPRDLVAVTENTYVCNGDERSFAFAHYTADLASDSTITADPGLADEDIQAVEWKTRLPSDTLQADILEHALESR